MATQQTDVFEKKPRVRVLAIGNAFNTLARKEQLYAHHMARAAWHGTRIILRQVSPESIAIFDFIMELYRTCDGDWMSLASNARVSSDEMNNFLEYAALFLANIGNYYGKGDQKFVPRASSASVKSMASLSSYASELYQEIEEPLFAPQPSVLGFPSDQCQSAYYLGDLRMSQEEIKFVSEVLQKTSVHPENTRIRKRLEGDIVVYDVLQASIEADEQPLPLQEGAAGKIRAVRGDHSIELSRICECLKEAQKYAANPQQEKVLSKYEESFRTGDGELYKESQRLWVKDLRPAVETIIGFVEPYRDPFGIRAEFEGLVGITNKHETEILTRLVERSDEFIRQLPWAENHTENHGKGPFEKSQFDDPGFTSLHTLAYCSSIIFPGINLPNYNDIRQEIGSKNVMITNSMNISRPEEESAVLYVHSDEASRYVKHRKSAFYLWVVFHELLGHGTGKLLVEKSPGSYNFDIENRPTNPLTGESVQSWYRPGQTWTGVFEDLATTVDECRAECVGAYLMSDMSILALFGFSEDTETTGKDLEYNMYLQLGVAGLRALENYDLENNKWGQAHSRAHFGIFKTLLAKGEGFLQVKHEPTERKLTVLVDESKVTTHGKPALGTLLMKLHIYRCTADIQACREFYTQLTTPEGIFLDWRQTVLANKPANEIFVQANTSLKDNQVVLKEYDATFEGLVQSWAERAV